MAIRLALLCFGTLLALILAEGAARFLPEPPTIQTVGGAVQELQREQGGQPNQSAQSLTVLSTDAVHAHTAAGKRLRPNMNVRIHNDNTCRCDVELRTNSLGYRNPPIESKDPHRERVLFLGDSITLAHYVPESKSWVRLVEQLDRENVRPFETINAGVYAIGLANELSILKETGLSTEPDTVVLGFYLNDFEGSSGIVIRRPPEVIRWSALARQVFYRVSFLDRYFERKSFSVLPAETIQEWKKEIEERFPPGQTTHDYRTNPAGLNKLIVDLVFDFGGAWSEQAWDFMTPLFEEFQRLSVQHGFKPRIVIFPVEYQVGAQYLYDFPQQKLLSLAKELGIPALDLLPVLRDAVRTQNRPLFYDWCHHTPPGQEVIASSVHRFLRENS